MKTRNLIRIAIAVMCVAMLVTALPFSAFAAWINDNVVLSGDKFGTNGYYNVISRKDYTLVPGAAIESDIVLNNADGTRRQEVHVMEIDTSNPDVTILPGYYGIDKYDPSDSSTWHAMELSKTIKYYEENLGYNIVGGMNTNLCYENDSVQGFLVFNRQVISTPDTDSHGDEPYYIAFLEDENGKLYCESRNPGDPLTGEEIYAVSTSTFGFYVKDGSLCVTQEDRTGISHPRSVVGVKEDGTLVMMMVNGRMVSSAGLTGYEIGEFMLSLGCKWALNCDGGGSSTFITKRQGEDELTMRSIPSDGAERPTIQSLLIASNVAPTGILGSAEIKSEYEAFAPHSEYTFTASALDTNGYAMAMPEGMSWSLSDSSYGTVENGKFISNGKRGTVDVQVNHNGEKVGSYTIKVMDPYLSAVNSNLVVPYGKSTNIGLQCMMSALEAEEKEVYTTPDAFDFAIDPAGAGSMNGFDFVATSEETITSATLTATYKYATDKQVVFNVSLGKATEVLWDFDDAAQLDEFTTAAIGLGMSGHTYRPDNVKASYATSANGMVHDGTGAVRFEVNMTNFAHPVNQNARFQFMPRTRHTISGAKSIGAWVYIPDDLWIGRFRFILREVQADGSLSGAMTYVTLEAPAWYVQHEDLGSEGRWAYFKANIDSSKTYVLGNLADLKDDLALFDFQYYNKVPNNNSSTMFSAGTVGGKFNFYIDSIQVDYSDAIPDREAPTITDMVYLGANESATALVTNTLNTTACEMLTVNSNILNLRATVREITANTNYSGLDYSSAKILVDGAEAPVKASGEYMTLSNYEVADGVHRITFVISDKQGNETRKTRWINVRGGSDASTVALVPKDATLDKLPAGSLYWMNLNATKIETIKSVTVVIDKNSVNHWELDHMVLADGFTAAWSVDEYEQTATITLTRTGKNTQSGAATLAELPIRIIGWDDIYSPLLAGTESALGGVGFNTPEGFSAGRKTDNVFAWPHDLKLEIIKGEIEFVDTYTQSAANTFANEYFRVNTQWYAHPNTVLADSELLGKYGWLHIHTESDPENKAATCTAAGYTGRTSCSVCNSIVNWGASQNASGHTYSVVNGRLVCDCGDAITTSGLVEIGDKTYYTIAGKLTTGWAVDGNDYYYFDLTTYEALKNGRYSIDGFDYSFDENGIHTEGQWVHLFYNGKYETRYKFAGKYVSEHFHTIDGKTYWFGENGLLAKGSQIIQTTDGRDNKYIYIIDDEGVVDGVLDYTGVYDLNGDLYYVVGGKLTGGGVMDINGSRYYVEWNGTVPTGRIYIVQERTNGLVEKGWYFIDKDGMIDEEFYSYDGKLYYIVDGQPAKGLGVISKNGAMYYVNGMGVVESGKIYVSENMTGGLVNAGYIYTDENGRIYDNEFVTIDGKVMYLVKGQPSKTGGSLVKEMNGGLYFVEWNGNIPTGKIYVSESETNGLTNAGWHYTDENGRFYNNEIASTVDGNFYMINGQPDRTGVSGVREINGGLYFVEWNGNIPTGKQYITSGYVNGLTGIGWHYTDDSGRMYDNEFTHIDGELYYMVKGQPDRTGVSKVREINGGLYFVEWNGHVLSGTQYIGEEYTNGLTNSGWHYTDNNGRMYDNEFATVDGSIYYMVKGQPDRTGVSKVRKINGNLYFVEWNGMVTSGKQYIGDAYTNGLTTAGWHYADENGKLYDREFANIEGAIYYMVNGKPDNTGVSSIRSINGKSYFIEWNGRVAFGKIYTEDGVRYAGVDGAFYNNELVEIDGELYFMVNGEMFKGGVFSFNGSLYYAAWNGKLARNGKAYVSADEANDLIIYGYHQFDENGKMYA